MPKKESAMSLQRAALRQSGSLKKTVMAEVGSVIREVRANEAERRAQAQAIADTAAGVARMEQQIVALQTQLAAAREEAQTAKASAEALHGMLQIVLQNQSVIADLVFTGTSRTTLTAWTAATRLEGVVNEDEVVAPVEAKFCPKPTHEADGRLGWLEVATGPESPWRYPDLGWRKS
jgi:hypothetical protein